MLFTKLRRQPRADCGYLNFVIFFLLFIWLAFPGAITAKIIYVPTDSSTIQKGIDSAFDGDTVLVLPGLYYENIDFSGKKILVASDFIFDQDQKTVDSTIIDGSCEKSVVVFVSGEDSNSVLAGFTIQNGRSFRIDEFFYGGGIYCSSSPIIRNNKITKNKDHFGGGIACMYKACRAKIVENLFIQNEGVVGGGIFIFDSSPTVLNNRIVDNEASYRGGGIFCKFANPLIVGNEITDNYAEVNGGGIYTTYSSTKIIGNIIAFNQAKENGGGEYSSVESFGVIRENLIYENIAGYGGGIYQRNCNSLIANNTIVGNYAEVGGGLVLSGSSYHPQLLNNIVCNSKNGCGIFCKDGSLPSLNYNDVWNNKGGNFFGCPSGVGDTSWGENFNGTPCDSFYNFSQDPFFLNPDKNLYQLLCGSPCRKAGVFDLLLGENERVDLGALEYTTFLGNADDENGVEVADIIYLAFYLFKSGPPPCDFESVDLDCDGKVGLSDLMHLANYIFRNIPFPCQKRFTL